jgi:hypothetical protein
LRRRRHGEDAREDNNNVEHEVLPLLPIEYFNITVRLTVCVDTFFDHRISLTRDELGLSECHHFSVFEPDAAYAVSNSIVGARIMIRRASYRVSLSIVDMPEYDFEWLAVGASTPSAVTAKFCPSPVQVAVLLFGAIAAPVNVDFSRLSFHVPISGSTPCAFAGMAKMAAMIAMM